MNSKDLLVFFAEQWKEKHDGKAYPISWGKEGAQFKRLLTSYDADYCRSLVVCFFRSGNHSEFASTAGFSVGAFVSQVPKLIGEQIRQEQADGASKATATDAARMAEARRRIIGEGR